MKLAVSNIAWPVEQDAEVADLFRDLGISGLEIAPTKIWSKPLAATDAELYACRRFWNDRCIEIVAAQALLFGKPELTIFGSAEIRKKTLQYLTGIIDLCAKLGAGSLVFGSPKNRLIGNLDRSAAIDIAAEFFYQLGESALAAGTTIVMEANPPDYGADFITRAEDAIALVKLIDHRGFRLHLDTGCMTLANDPVAETLDAGFPLLRHFHISEPNLAPPGASCKVDHRAFAAELNRRGYPHWVSLEMREQVPFSLEGLASVIREVQTIW